MDEILVEREKEGEKARKGNYEKRVVGVLYCAYCPPAGIWNARITASVHDHRNS